MRYNPFKVIVVLAVTLLAAVHTPAQAQDAAVTASYRNAPLMSVIKDVESKTGYRFVYEIKDVNSAAPVTASFKSASLQTVLSKVFASEFTWTVNGKMVALIRKNAPAVAATPANREPASTPTKVVVTGTVVDGNSLPVVGAAITVKGNQSLGGCITDAKGEFRFEVPKGSVLQVTSIGYSAVENAFDKPENWFVTLDEDAVMLNDVVVVGYGVQKKESVVGAISQVSTEDIVNSGTTNITNSLAGKLSGVQTYQTSGQPGKTDAKIYIRGLSSWNNDDPLVMVDGVERSFNDLDPNEVATISVLKDASATAVFGAKGANGVILVTTKTGVKGKAKTHISVEAGLENPTRLPEHTPSYEVVEFANIALKNQGSFGSLYSDDVIEAYRTQSNPLRYPDNDWYGMLLRTFAPTLNANYSLSGGGDRVKYFVSIGYLNEGSVVRVNHDMIGNAFSYNKINYRSNLDINLTGSTVLHAKIGGTTAITGRPNGVDVTDLFNDMYKSSGAMYPAYFPAWFVEQNPDPDYPDDKAARISNSGVGFEANPYQDLATEKYTEATVNKLSTDFALDQKLDFITKGLSASAKIALTTQYQRTSRSASHSYPNYEFDWSAYERGENPWISSKSGSEVVVIAPYSESQNNAASSTSVVFYWEGSLNYSRKFGNHDVSAMALFNQRESISNVAFPRRNEAVVGRATYNYKGKYFIEGNVGYTGSEQFAPANRFGFFPAGAVGYTISKERFWQQSMPWWSKMKFRFSDGLVGTDSADARWLYVSNFTKANGVYIEGDAANITARWETARKRDLGVEMGWFDNAFTLDVDFFDEHRYDMIVDAGPIVTPLVAVNYMPINAGELKKHGYEVEAKYRRTSSSGLYHEIGGMFSFNENRILKYADYPYSPSYQKWAGTPYGAQRSGVEQIEGGFFSCVDDIHNYPVNYSDWTYVYPGVYKIGDYNADGNVDTDDYHPIRGTQSPLYVYSFNLGLGYKGWTLNALFYGNAGKYTEFLDVYETEFYKSDLIVHTSQRNYWTPTNNSREVHRSPSYYRNFNDSRFFDHTWRASHYLTFKELYLAYKFDGDRLKQKFGVNGLTVLLTGNNLFTFTPLIEGDPQKQTLNSSYYPVARVVKLGVKLDF